MARGRGNREREPVAMRHGAAEIVFTWQADRWRHDIRSGHARWCSVEAAERPGGDPRWPDSPVIVEVSRLEAGARPALLGVGLAGRSHFSLSVTPHPDLPDAFLFEAACRIVEPPGWLGSTYRDLAGGGDVTRFAAAMDPAAGLPRTECWSYSIGPAGIAAAACGGPADRSHFAEQMPEQAHRRTPRRRFSDGPGASPRV